MSIFTSQNRDMIRRIAVAFCLIAVGLFLADTLFAQEASGIVQQKKTWFQLFKATGIVGILLLLLSVGGFALVIEHFVNLKLEKIMPPEVVEQLDEELERGSTEKAYEVCQARDVYITRVVKAGLEAGGTGELAQEAARETGAEETFNLNTKISYLSLVGNIGPLLGLLGTVTGMITAFQEIEQKKAPTPADLAQGVYESLVNTTMGLFAAIIFLTAYFIFKNKVSKMTLTANNTAIMLLRDRSAAA